MRRYEEIVSRGEAQLVAQEAVEEMVDEFEAEVEARDEAFGTILRLDAEKRAMSVAYAELMAKYTALVATTAAPPVAEARVLEASMPTVVHAMPIDEALEPLAEAADEMEDNFEVAAEIADGLGSQLAATKAAYGELKAATDAARAAAAVESDKTVALQIENAELRAQLLAAQEMILSLTKSAEEETPAAGNATNDAKMPAEADAPIENSAAPVAEKATRIKRAAKAKVADLSADKENGAAGNERTRRSTRLTTRA